MLAHLNRPVEQLEVPLNTVAHGTRSIKYEAPTTNHIAHT
jgi:hypothetical protein